MNRKKITLISTILVTTIAAPTSFAYWNLSKQKKEVTALKEQAKISLRQIEKQLETVKIREITANQTLKLGEQKIRKSEDLSKKAIKQIAESKQVSTAAQKEKQVSILKQKELQDQQSLITKTQQKLEAKIATQTELHRINTLKNKQNNQREEQLNNELIKARTSITEAAKAQSTSLWHQKKAKEQIKKYEQQTANTIKAQRHANAIHAKAERILVSHQRLKAEFDAACDKIEKLQKEQSHLYTAHEKLKSKHKKLEKVHFTSKKETHENLLHLKKLQKKEQLLQRELNQSAQTIKKSKSLTKQLQDKITRLEKHIAKSQKL